jgi:hypothetical protein
VPRSTMRRTRHCEFMRVPRGGFSRYMFLLDSRLAPSSFLCPLVSHFAFPRVSSAGNRSWRAELGRGTTASLS